MNDRIEIAYEFAHAIESEDRKIASKYLLGKYSFWTAKQQEQ